MGSRGNRSKPPDLFSTVSARETVSQPVVPSARHVLPADLPNTIKQLGDDELERLVAAALGEQKLRGGKSDRLSDKRKVELARVK
jgi:hypothetical protein